jgi:hypothetical protein
MALNPPVSTHAALSAGKQLEPRESMISLRLSMPRNPAKFWQRRNAHRSFVKAVAFLGAVGTDFAKCWQAIDLLSAEPTAFYR